MSDAAAAASRDAARREKKPKRQKSKRALKRQRNQEEYIRRLRAMTADERKAYLQRIGGKLPRGFSVDGAGSNEAGARPAKTRRKAGHRIFRENRRLRQAVEFEDIRYVCKNGLRCVVPYRHIYETYAKGRWEGRTIVEVFSSEFGTNPPSYYTEAISRGFITVNGQRVATDYVIRHNDVLTHITHKHEPPVSGVAITVAAVSDKVVVVNKPPSMPVHSCGAYTHNCVQHILKRERPDLGPLHAVHRLDRLTSGVLIFARDPQSAAEISQAIRDKAVQKFYVARVHGSLPSASEAAANLAALSYVSITADAVGAEEHRRGSSSLDSDKLRAFTLSCPLKCVDPRVGVHGCAADGKEAATHFELIATDGVSSVVRCRPISGRTHQIRLHLQLLGCPIANDPNYGPEDNASADGFSVMGFTSDRSGGGSESSASASDAVSVPAAVQPAPAARGQKTQQKPPGAGAPNAAAAELASLREICVYCNSGAVKAFTSTQLRHAGIWLHAYRYEGRGWRYEVALPDWASLETNA